VIEISGGTFRDDLGAKRLLYERLGVAEYWVVNVAEQDVIAFAIADQRSGEVQTSEVLPGLEIALVEEALRRSQTEDDSTSCVGSWIHCSEASTALLSAS
jgi:Uma2 family endonuclease